MNADLSGEGFWVERLVRLVLRVMGISAFSLGVKSCETHKKMARFFRRFGTARFGRRRRLYGYRRRFYGRRTFRRAYRRLSSVRSFRGRSRRLSGRRGSRPYTYRLTPAGTRERVLRPGFVQLMAVKSVIRREKGLAKPNEDGVVQVPAGTQAKVIATAGDRVQTASLRKAYQAYQRVAAALDFDPDLPTGVSGPQREPPQMYEGDYGGEDEYSDAEEAD